MITGMSRCGYFISALYQSFCFCNETRKEEKSMSKTMTQQSYDKILEAAKILCEYCENNACENCQLTRLTDDAYLDAIEEGIIDDA